MTRPDRREFLIQSLHLAAAASLAGGPASSIAAAGGYAPASGRPHAAFEPVALADVRWAEGLWGDRSACCRDVMVPAMGRLMAGTEHGQFLENFRIAGGLAPGRHRGPAWNDGDFYKWLEAAAAVHAAHPDPALDRQLDEAIAVIARAQRPDGYLHTPVLIKVRNGEPAEPFADRLDFEMYNLGHLMTAACVHRRATGKDTLLAVAVKAADFLVAAFRSPSPHLARNAVCPSHYMGLVDLARETGDARYRDLARDLVDLRDRVASSTDGTDDNQDRIPFRKQREALGHAVRANYLYAGAADVHLETGDPTLLDPLLAIWDDLVGRKMAITGACGALFDGASPDGAKDQKAIARVHQAYGRAYQLPNSTAHNETCAAIGNALWNWRMLRITGEARFGDVLETVLHNALLAGVSLDGTKFFYTNTLRQLDRMPVPLRWSRAREASISCFCCPPNVVRTVAEVGGLAYGRSERRLWVHLYGSNTVAIDVPGAGRFELKQETDYPWDGRIRITVTAAPAGTTTLALRIPVWSRGATLAVNGTNIEPAPTPGRYTEVARAWAAGDVVELDLPMAPRLVQAHPLVEEARNQVAVRRGPIVYCLESVDLPAGTKVLDVAIPRGIRWTPRHAPGLLGGVTVLEGRAEARPEADWGGDLYRELPDAPARPVDVRLVPYYAWGNRGPSEMTVWLPLS